MRFENPALFFPATQRWKKGGNFRSRKNRVLESCSNIFFSLAHLNNNYNSSMQIESELWYEEITLGN